MEEKCSHFLCIGKRVEKCTKPYPYLQKPKLGTTEGFGIELRKSSKQLSEHYRNLRKNITYERHWFNMRNQAEAESGRVVQSMVKITQG